MTLEDRVYESLTEYPIMYLCDNFEDSRMLVLHHLFMVNGNGYYWAQTKRPQDAGYLVLNRGQKRKYDAPYGKQKFQERPSMKELLKDYYSDWKQRIVNETTSNEGVRKALLNAIENEEADKRYPNDILKLRLYPFNIEYSTMRDIDLENLKTDWRAGMIEIYEYALLKFKKAKGNDYRGTHAKRDIIDHLKKALKILEGSYAKSA